MQNVVDANTEDQAAAAPEAAAIKDNTVLKMMNGRSPLNDVVCGAMMLAYERSGCWAQVFQLHFEH